METAAHQTTRLGAHEKTEKNTDQFLVCISARRIYQLSVIILSRAKAPEDAKRSRGYVFLAASIDDARSGDSKSSHRPVPVIIHM